jgi:hypothetical protein
MNAITPNTAIDDSPPSNRKRIYRFRARTKRTNLAVLRVTRNELLTQLGRDPTPAELEVINVTAATKLALHHLHEKLLGGDVTDRDLSLVNSLANTISRNLAFLGLLDRTVPEGTIRPNKTTRSIYVDRGKVAGGGKLEPQSVAAWVDSLQAFQNDR